MNPKLSKNFVTTVNLAHPKKIFTTVYNTYTQRRSSKENSLLQYILTHPEKIVTIVYSDPSQEGSLLQCNLTCPIWYYCLYLFFFPMVHQRQSKYTTILLLVFKISQLVKNMWDVHSFCTIYCSFMNFPKILFLMTFSPR